MVAKSIGLASSHVLAGKIALSVFDDGKTCSIVFAVVVAVICPFPEAARSAIGADLEIRPQPPPSRTAASGPV